MQKKQIEDDADLFLWPRGDCTPVFVPPGMTVNADAYCDILRRLRENVLRKKPQKW